MHHLETSSASLPISYSLYSSIFSIPVEILNQTYQNQRRILKCQLRKPPLSAMMEYACTALPAVTASRPKRKAHTKTKDRFFANPLPRPPRFPAVPIGLEAVVSRITMIVRCTPNEARCLPTHAKQFDARLLLRLCRIVQSRYTQLKSPTGVQRQGLPSYPMLSVRGEEKETRE